jgi:hypothetical protein
MMRKVASQNRNPTALISPTVKLALFCGKFNPFPIRMRAIHLEIRSGLGYILPALLNYVIVERVFQGRNI